MRDAVARSIGATGLYMSSFSRAPLLILAIEPTFAKSSMHRQRKRADRRSYARCCPFDLSPGHCPFRDAAMLSRMIVHRDCLRRCDWSRV